MNDEGDEFGSGDTRSFTTSATISGGGSWIITGDDPFGCTENWTYEGDPGNQDMNIAGANFWVDLDPSHDYGTGCSQYVSIPNFDFTFDKGCGDLPHWQMLGSYVEGLLKTINEFTFDIPKKREGWTFTKTHSVSTNDDFWGIKASGEITVSVQLIPPGAPKWEMVMIPQPHPMTPTYEEWLPRGKTSESTPGNSMFVDLLIRGKNDTNLTAPRSKITFTLADVSREPGICMNFPHRDQPAHLDGAQGQYDLKFAENSSLTIGEDGQSAEMKDLSTGLGGLEIECFDYGASGKLKVVAQTEDGETLVAYVEGHPDQDFLSIPLDENQNQIADFWEKENGTWGDLTDPKWDGADQPDGQDADGDGISLFEKYRGFLFANAHERLQPHRKHVFVFDPDGVAGQDLQSILSFQKGSLLRVRFVSPETWTGPGPAASGKRVVNFNSSGFGHATDQHAEHVRMISAQSPGLPSDYQAAFRAKNGTNSTESVGTAFGMTYPDSSVAKTAWSPEQWIVIEDYLWGIDRYARDVVRYHTYALPQFAGYGAASPADRARMDTLIEKEVTDHIAAHPNDWEELNWLVLMMTTSHEMGHGVAVQDLAAPRNRGPMNCFIRYLDWSLPRNPNDRFDTASRWHNAPNQPSIFCHDPTATVPGKGCFEQIHVTDREGAAAAVAGLRSPATPPAFTRTQGKQAPPTHLEDPLVNQQFISIGEPSPLLKISAELEWEPVLAGDPLRLTVRLSTPAWSEALELALLQGVLAAAPPPPPVGSNWISGLRLELARTESDGTRTRILSSDQWQPYLRAVLVDPDLFERRLSVRQREFLVSPEAAKLQPGEYALTLNWDGSGLVDSQFLPPGGKLAGEEIRFAVGEATNDLKRAQQLRRLAFQAWDAGDNESARRLGTDALRLDPNTRSREVIETGFVIASAAVRQGDLFGSASSLQQLRAGTPGLVGLEIAERIGSLLSALAPELIVKDAGSSVTPARLEIVAHPGETYLLQGSSDLRDWTVLRELIPAVNRSEVTLSELSGAHHYFRLAWSKP